LRDCSSALPQHLLSRGMHALARSKQPFVRNTLIRTVLRSYPQIDMREAQQPDPFVYDSFNAFFTRALRPGARTITADTGRSRLPRSMAP
jgi:phosphatidylserine decarboxylase